MPSLIQGFEYDIFISYRHNDNKGGWVSEFVQHLNMELAATLKDPVSVYFDHNIHDGLLESHSVDKSLEGKLKCLIFIPIISQTYCDPKSFAWQHEFCAFNRMAGNDALGRDIKLANGNVASRILPIRIHDLDPEDQALFEKETVSVLRGIEFIYRSAGVVRPLKPVEEDPKANLNHTFYDDQINKVARAVKELILGMKHVGDDRPSSHKPVVKVSAPRRKAITAGVLTVAAISLLSFCYYYFMGGGEKLVPSVDRSIAVLPFVNMSNDPEQEYFSDGMTDEVLNRLFKLGALKVISRTTSMKFKGAKLTAKEIANQLGVANILEGSVQKAGNRLKITVQLIDANSDNHLWSETYERDFKDIFAVQSDIATAVANELRIKLTAQVKSNLAKVPTQNRAAYEYYLKAYDFETRYEMDSAIKLYSKAIDEDSMFVAAYAKRAHAHLFRYWLRYTGWEPHKDLAYPDIEVLRRINPELPEFKISMAYWQYYAFRDYNKALELVQELERIEPNYPEIHNIRFALYRRQGKWEESLKESEIVLAADPLNAIERNEFCHTYRILHRYKELRELSQKGEALLPGYGFKWGIHDAEVNLHYSKEAAERKSGLTDEELGWMKDYFNRDFMTALKKIRKNFPREISNQEVVYPVTFQYATMYYLDGNRKMAKIYADSALNALNSRLPEMMLDDRIYVSLGYLYAFVGKNEKAIECGKKAVELLPVSRDAWFGATREIGLMNIYVLTGNYEGALELADRLLTIPSEFGIGWLMVDPLYDPLRKLPAYKRLVEKYTGKKGV